MTAPTDCDRDRYICCCCCRRSHSGCNGAEPANNGQQPHQHTQRRKHDHRSQRAHSHRRRGRRRSRHQHRQHSVHAAAAAAAPVHLSPHRRRQWPPAAPHAPQQPHCQPDCPRSLQHQPPVVGRRRTAAARAAATRLRLLLLVALAYAIVDGGGGGGLMSAPWGHGAWQVRSASVAAGVTAAHTSSSYR